VRFENIELHALSAATPISIGDQLSVTPKRVPHRDEYSETVAYVIDGPERSILFLPDIDDWDRWESEYGEKIENVLAAVDVAYLDATFFDDNELPGRDMSKIPHPRLLESMQRFTQLPLSERNKVRFFHLNHTNAARFADSKQRQVVKEMGFRIAEQSEHVCLD